jgi:starch synthase
MADTLAETLKIAFIASECVPYAKTGGLGDVVGALPKALRRLGHTPIVILPRYAFIDYIHYGLRPFLSPLGVWMGGVQEWCSVHAAENDGVPVYFIESRQYFDRYGLYHDAEMNDYQDNARRFGFFTRAALQLCRDMGFAPDIVHAHDWQTAAASAYLKIWHWDDRVLGGASSVLTIHNVAYQGVYNAADYDYLGFQRGNFSPDKFEDHGQLNLLKGGIHYADLVNTVSPTYAAETRTPYQGHGLAPYLSGKGPDYVGILNGADYDQWDPTIDRLIPKRYSRADLSGKAACKEALQRRFLLEVDPGIPIVGAVSRLADQKGLHLLAAAIEPVLQSMRVQFVILGAGDKGLEWYYGGLPARYPGRVGSYIGYNEEIAHWIEAGSDFFIMPSIFEPCGLNQMYSLRYGTLPIVRATGGLEDTVQQYDEETGAGTGFKFSDANPTSIYYAIGWAVSTYYDRPEHLRKMIQSAMVQDYSWEKSARLYVQAYRQAIRNKNPVS